MDLPRRLVLDSLYEIMYHHKFCDEILEFTLKKFVFTAEEKHLFITLLEGSLDKVNNIFYYLEPNLSSRAKKWVKVFSLVMMYEIIYLESEKEKVFSIYDALFNLNNPLIYNEIKRVVTKACKNFPIDYKKLSPIEALSKKYSYPNWFIASLLKDYRLDKIEKLISLPKKDYFSFLETQLKFDEVIMNWVYKGEKIVLYNGVLPGNRIKKIVHSAEKIFATDIETKKIKGLEKRFLKANIDTVSFQIIRPEEVSLFVKDETFDLVILDMPSTGTGFVSRSFEWKYRISPEGIKSVCDLQKLILFSNSKLVKKSGNICLISSSILKSETTHLIKDFLIKNPEFFLEEETQLNLGDWFYLARLKRK